MRGISEDFCDFCAADLKFFQYSRRIAVVDRDKDCVVAYRCPDCSTEIPRDQREVASMTDRSGAKKETLLNFFAVARGLASVRRFSMDSLQSPESVLEHTGMVALTCLLICKKLEVPAADTAECLTAAIVHDIEEVFVGDVARPTKHHSDATKRMFEDLSRIGVARVERLLGVELAEDHENAKLGSLGCLVALADILAVVYKIWAEVVIHGNLSLCRHADMIPPQLTAVAARIKRHWGQNDFLEAIISEAAAVALAASASKHPLLKTLREEFKNED